MSPLAILIGVPLGFWLSDVVHNAPKTYQVFQERHAATMEKRFGADQRKCEEYANHQARVAEADREHRAEFRRRNNG